MICSVSLTNESPCVCFRLLSRGDDRRSTASSPVYLQETCQLDAGAPIEEIYSFLTATYGVSAGRTDAPGTSIGGGRRAISGFRLRFAIHPAN